MPEFSERVQVVMDPDILALDPFAFFICIPAILLGVALDDAAERAAVIAFDPALALHVGLADQEVDLHRPGLGVLLRLYGGQAKEQYHGKGHQSCCKSLKHHVLSGYLVNLLINLTSLLRLLDAERTRRKHQLIPTGSHTHLHPANSPSMGASSR